MVTRLHFTLQMIQNILPGKLYNPDIILWNLYNIILYNNVQLCTKVVRPNDCIVSERNPTCAVVRVFMTTEQCSPRRMFALLPKIALINDSL